MQRFHLPRLTVEQLGIEGIAGWYFEPSTRDEKKEWVIFQCKCNRRSSFRLHAIDQEGNVTASVLCPFNCGFHEWCILDDWDSDYIKKANDWYPIHAKSGV